MTEANETQATTTTTPAPPKEIPADQVEIYRIERDSHGVPTGKIEAFRVAKKNCEHWTRFHKAFVNQDDCQAELDRETKRRELEAQRQKHRAMLAEKAKKEAAAKKKREEEEAKKAERAKAAAEKKNASKPVESATLAETGETTKPKE